MASTSIAYSEDVADDAPSDDEASIIEIDTKFGPLRFDPDKVVNMSQGILGFPGYTQYGLATLPDERYGQFMILQSIENPELSFPVLPLEFLGGAMAEDHIAEAFEALGMPRDSAAVLVIVTVRKLDDKVSLSANLRAPIFIESLSRTGRQFVLPQSEYDVRHPL